MAARASWERESQNLIEETTKSCPGCHTKTERSGSSLVFKNAILFTESLAFFAFTISNLTNY